MQLPRAWAGRFVRLQEDRCATRPGRIHAGLPLSPFIGLTLDCVSGVVITTLRAHSFLSLINNGFHILNADPFYRELATGPIILAAIGVSASGKRT